LTERGTAIQPYGLVANLRKFFRESMAGAATLAVTHSPRKNLVLSHENPRRSFAFGSSQRNRMTLMFAAARFCEQALSASRAIGFRHEPRGVRAAPRCRMQRKCFMQRWFLERTRCRAAPWGASASTDTLFHCHRHAGKRKLPSLRRNAPEVCRKTSGVAPPAAGHAP
jgi:hypothetical protein